jgi:hypothetical protein
MVLLHFSCFSVISVVFAYLGVYPQNFAGQKFRDQITVRRPQILSPLWQMVHRPALISPRAKTAAETLCSNKNITIKF